MLRLHPQNPKGTRGPAHAHITDAPDEEGETEADELDGGDGEEVAGAPQGAAEEGQGWGGREATISPHAQPNQPDGPAEEELEG